LSFEVHIDASQGPFFNYGDYSTQSDGLELDLPMVARFQQRTPSEFNYFNT